jgi:hypothetical protein
MHQRFGTIAGIPCPETFFGLEFDQGIEIFIGPENYVSSPASVASIRSAFVYIFFPPEVGGTVSTLAGFTLYNRDIAKFAHSFLLTANNIELFQ